MDRAVAFLSFFNPVHPVHPGIIAFYKEKVRTLAGPHHAFIPKPGTSISEDDVSCPSAHRRHR